MKLCFLKIDRILQKETIQAIEIPSGGIQFEHKGQVIQSMEPLYLEMTHCGMFKNILRTIEFAVYTDQSLEIVELTQASVYSIVSHEDVQRAIYKEIAKWCKVVPFSKPLDERELLAREYEFAYQQIAGV